MPTSDATMTSSVSNSGTMSDGTDSVGTTSAESSGDSQPPVTSVSQGSDSSTDPSGDPTTDPSSTDTRDATDDSTTDPTQGESTTNEVEEVCDGVDNDGDGGIDEGSPSNAVCDDCLFVEATAGPFWFAVCSEPFTWDLARVRCADFGPGGDLAKIENAVDQAALLGLVAEDHWMGVDDLQTDGLWFWVDGTQARAGAMVFGYDGWGMGQPDGELAENCAELDPGQTGWADSPCNQSQPIVCRHDA